MMATLWGRIQMLFGMFCVMASALHTPLASAQPQELREAHASVVLQDSSREADIALPYYWDRLHKGQSGYATFDIKFSLPELPKAPYGLYLPKLGNAYEVFLNGEMIQRNGDMTQFNRSDYAKVPRFIEIAPNELSTHNLLQIHIRADEGRRAGLSTLWIGPYEVVYPLYLRNFRWIEIGSMLVMAFSIVVGLVSLALWLTQVDYTPGATRKRDPLYALAAAGELCWALGVSNFITERDWIAWPWSGIIIFMTTPMWSTCMTLFSVEIAGWGQTREATWLRRWLVFLMGACLVGAVAQHKFGYPAIFTVWYLTFGVTYILFGVFFTFKTRPSSTFPHKLVTFSLLTNVVVGIYDIYALRLSNDYPAQTFLRYSSVLFGATLFYIVISRFMHVSRQARDLMQNMAERIMEKEVALGKIYQENEQFVREQERTLERTRILRDMHDGVGAHISTAIRQLQSGNASNETVLHTMRESLDQLKLSVDVMRIPAGDVTALLANLRYRLEPRFREACIDLQWDVYQMTPLTRLESAAMRHLQFMLFEAMSNVLQHAKATALRVELTENGTAGSCLKIIDNGVGFEVNTDAHRGLKSLRERAALISVTLDVTSQPGQTVVAITLE